MAIKQSDYFNLDSNVDGFYVDVDGNVNIVNDMIGVVGATDGVAAYPLSTAKGAPLSKRDLEDLGLKELAPDVIRNTRGHGLLYDKNGNHVANKGEMFFRDGQGNFSTLKKLTGQTNLINQQGDALALRDFSLFDNGYTNDIGIELDELLRLASLKSTNFSKGNILQLARNTETRVNTVQVPTISLITDATVWVVGRVMVRGSGSVILTHMETGAILDTVYYEHPRDFVMPCYISWIGTLAQTDLAGTDGDCKATIWDVATKTFTRIYNPTSEVTQAHTLEMQTVDGNFLSGNLNIMCMERKVRQVSGIKNGSDAISGGIKHEVTFDEEFDDEGYSISIQIESPLQTWYTEKTVSGFTINIEREYQGKVFWTAIRTE